jgi:hypothetical protein
VAQGVLVGLVALAGLAWLTFAVVIRPAISSPKQDPGFDDRVQVPAYRDVGPRLLMDRGHFNLRTPVGQSIDHTLTRLATSDGYRVAVHPARFGPEALEGAHVLVIAMAGGGATAETAAADALTATEVNVVVKWVESGGGLLLAFDHFPNDRAIGTLAASLGVTVGAGLVDDPDHSRTPWRCLFCKGWNSFRRETGLLARHPITDGGSEATRIDEVVAFGGSSLTAATEASELLKLSPAARSDERAVDGTARHARGRAQGAAFTRGAGRVVMLADSNMIASQVLGNGLGAIHMGLGYSGAGNRQFLLNALHWLSRLID